MTRLFAIILLVAPALVHTGAQAQPAPSGRKLCNVGDISFDPALDVNAALAALCHSPQ